MRMGLVVVGESIVDMMAEMDVDSSLFLLQDCENNENGTE